MEDLTTEEYDKLLKYNDISRELDGSINFKAYYSKSGVSARKSLVSKGWAICDHGANFDEGLPSVQGGL